jgi:signal transduction histidine kinase
LEKDGHASEQNREDLKHIIEAVEQMRDSVTRVREAATQLKPILGAHDIRDILCNSFTRHPSFAQEFQDRSIQTGIVGLEQLKRHTFQCDRNLIEEAIFNLVQNALEAVSDGGIITMQVAESDGELAIEVQDNGPGVDEARHKLFDPFNTTKRGGLGLGLFIVRRNVAAHGGAVSYEKKGGGSCFRIVLPWHGQKENG